MSPEPAGPPTPRLGWLIRFRWAFFAAAVFGIAVQAAASPSAAVPLLAAAGVGLATNVLLVRRLPAITPTGDGLLVATMGLDLVIVTFLLALSGGASNPFAFAFLLHLTIAALVLPRAAGWAFAVLDGAAYGALFLVPHVHAHDATSMAAHLAGMWLAYAVCGPLVLLAIHGLRAEIEGADVEIAAFQQRAEQARRLEALATLAAGAAHELASPLATVAVVAKDLEASPAPEVREDAALIGTEIARCRHILAQLSADAGDGMGEAARWIAVGELLASVVESRSDADRVRIACMADLEARTVRVPIALVRQALNRLLDNARAASPDTPAFAEATRWGDRVRIAVRDHGAGMAPEVLRRAGEPFFTTRPVGEGMGLGLFFARAVARHVGGALVLESSPSGTVAAIELPLDPA